MPLEARLLTGLALSVAAAYLVTPLAIRLAHQFAFFDRPAGYKGHSAPTPYLGGAAVVAAFIAVLALVAPHDGRTLAVIGGVTVMWAVGTIDDRRTLAPGIRVAIEAGLAAALWLAGFGWEPSGIAPVDLFVTIAWTLAVVNAFNLFDNMDGATGSLTVVVATGLAALGVIEGSSWLALAGIALAGACLGFLPHNLSSPAKIFLGDGGSMPIGFAVAAITMAGAGELVPGWTGLLVALLLVAVPAADTALVIVSRRRRGISVLTGGRDHLTHRTRSRVGSPHATAAVLGGVQALVSALAILAARDGPGAAGVGAAVFLATAGGAIALLERDYARDSDVSSTAPSAPAPAWLVALLLLPAGLALGLSPFAGGYYDERIWIPVAAGLLVVLTTALVGSRLTVRPAGVMLAGGLAALAGITLLSSLWSPSAHDALVEGNRYVLYAALAAVLGVLLTRRNRAAWLFGGVTVGALIVGLTVAFRMLGGAHGLFVGGRLNWPLGYINGEASFFVLALWPCIGLAESRDRPLLAGLGAGAAALFAGLVVLGQSRGSGLALFAAIVVALLVLPGRLRRVGVIALLGVLMALSWHTLTGVFAAGSASAEHSAQRDAATLLLLISLIAGVAWGALSLLWREAAGQTARGVAAGAVAVLTVVAILGGVVKAHSISNRVKNQYHVFVHVEPTSQPGVSSRSRLLSGAGNRYEYWRVGWHEWNDHALAGDGGASFPVVWFRERRITEDVRQAHSLPLQTLGDTGVLGLLALLVALAGVALGVVRRRADVHEGTVARALVVGSVGIVAAWAVHTSVDWIHLLPGVTGIAVAAAAWLAAAGPRRATPVGIPVRLLLVVPVIVATVFVVRQGLADRERDTARADLRSNPTSALDHARRSLRFDGTSVESRWIEAAALARFGDGAGSAGVLRDAVAQEPDNFVTWALVGDLATRRGRSAAAKAAYAHAHRLNPRDPGLLLATKKRAAR